MSEQDGVSALPIKDDPTRPPPENPPAWPKLFSGLNALVWSAGIAVLAGLATCAGMAREGGRSVALGLFSLSRPAIDQRDTYLGMISLLEAVLAAVLVSVVVLCIYRAALWIGKKTPLHRLPLSMLAGSRWPQWTVLVAVLADVGFLNASVIKLARQANGIILKHMSDVGPVWPSILLDQDKDAVFGFMLIYGGGIAFLVAASWWLVRTKMKRPWTRIAFTTWVVAQLLGLLLGYSYLSGVADAVDDYPAVAFSGEEQLQAGSLAVFLGSDDKEFALLIVNSQAKPDLQRYILYLPRAEVKWMTVLRLMPLHPLANIGDLERPSH